jgi:hypothetical protein
LVLIVLGAQGATRLETAAKSAEPQAAQDISQPSNNTRTSKEELERWMKELSNRGRWGKDDERGTLNLITAAKQKQAAFDRLKTQGSGLRAQGLILALAFEAPETQGIQALSLEP